MFSSWLQVPFLGLALWCIPCPFQPLLSMSRELITIGCIVLTDWLQDLVASYAIQRHGRSWEATKRKSQDISPFPYHSTLANVYGSNCISYVASPPIKLVCRDLTGCPQPFGSLNHVASAYHSSLVVMIVISCCYSVPFVFHHMFDGFPAHIISNWNTCKVFHFP